MEAVKEGKFHIWPISTLDKALALMTVLEVGETQEDEGGEPAWARRYYHAGCGG